MTCHQCFRATGHASGCPNGDPCTVCGEHVERGERFFEMTHGRAHERCAMRDLAHVEHEETTLIVVDVSRSVCPSCVDGIDSDGERCTTCGGTADPARPFAAYARGVKK